MSQFDTIINRRNTGSLKWDLNSGVMPFWVADMDFKSPACILDKLKERVDHGVFGYAIEPEGFRELLSQYMEQRHGADVALDWFVHIGGCVPALATAARAFCGPGESIMTCSPVYPPIRSVHQVAGADLIDVPHTWEEGRWSFDWDAMEAAVRPDTRMYILCNPQNPLGRVFEEEELLKLADFCERHDLILCSDEIHCDLVLSKEATHFTAVRLPEKYRERILVLTAPSKTYNIAGIGYSMVMIPSPRLRERFVRVQEQFQPPVHCLAFASAQAAYAHCEEWRRELIDYLSVNRDELYEFVSREMPEIKLLPMQATYLAWMDCSALGLEDPQPFFLQEAGVFLNPGTPFGDSQCVRFNFGTSRALMREGLEKMAAALKRRRTS